MGGETQPRLSTPKTLILLEENAGTIFENMRHGIVIFCVQEHKLHTNPRKKNIHIAYQRDLSSASGSGRREDVSFGDNEASKHAHNPETDKE